MFRAWGSWAAVKQACRAWPWALVDFLTHSYPGCPPSGLHCGGGFLSGPLSCAGPWCWFCPSCPWRQPKTSNWLELPNTPGAQADSMLPYLWSDSVLPHLWADSVLPHLQADAVLPYLWVDSVLLLSISRLCAPISTWVFILFSVWLCIYLGAVFIFL